MADTQAAARRYIERVLKELRIAPGALAKLAGIAPSTLTRFLNDANHKFVLSSSTISKISDATGTIPFELIEDTAPYTSNVGRALSGAPVLGTFIDGAIELGVWRDVSTQRSNRELNDYITLSDTSWGAGKCLAVQVKGNSLGRTASEGDYLVFVPFNHFLTKKQVTDGDLVIVDRFSNDESLVERSARLVRLRFVSGKPELGFVNLHHPFEGQIFGNNGEVLERVSLDPSDSGSLKIVGVALYVVRALRAAQ